MLAVALDHGLRQIKKPKQTPPSTTLTARLTKRKNFTGEQG